MLREKVQRFNADSEIQAMLRQLECADAEASTLTRTYTGQHAAALKDRSFPLEEMADRKLGYQRLDQLVFELLTGAR